MQSSDSMLNWRSEAYGKFSIQSELKPSFHISISSWSWRGPSLPLKMRKVRLTILKCNVSLVSTAILFGFCSLTYLNLRTSYVPKMCYDKQMEWSTNCTKKSLYPRGTAIISYNKSLKSQIRFSSFAQFTGFVICYNCYRSIVVPCISSCSWDSCD